MVATDADLSAHPANVRGEELIHKSILDALRPLQRVGIVAEVDLKAYINNGIIGRVEAGTSQSHRNESR